MKSEGTHTLNRNDEAARMLRDYLSGDETAFRNLYHLFSEPVFNTALHYLRDWYEAEEATQEVFIKVHRFAPKFRFDSSVTTWIYRIAVNTCADRARSIKRRKIISGFRHLLGSTKEAAPQELKDKAPLPIQETEQKELHDALFQALERIPMLQRTAFILTNIEELSVKEAAEVLKKSIKATESLLQRAKGSLRKELKKI